MPASRTPAGPPAVTGAAAAAAVRAAGAAAAAAAVAAIRAAAGTAVVRAAVAGAVAAGTRSVVCGAVDWAATSGAAGAAARAGAVTAAVAAGRLAGFRFAIVLRAPGPGGGAGPGDPGGGADAVEQVQVGQHAQLVHGGARADLSRLILPGPLIDGGVGGQRLVGRQPVGGQRRRAAVVPPEPDPGLVPLRALAALACAVGVDGADDAGGQLADLPWRLP